MNKKSILITGTRKGIGKDLTKYYLSKSYHVIGCSRSNTDFKHDNYTRFNLDISDEQSVKKMFLSIRKKKINLEILINNAGLASMNHFLLTPLKNLMKFLIQIFLAHF